MEEALIVYQKSLATGKVWAHFDSKSWDLLKAKLVRLPEFLHADMDNHDSSWEILRDGQIINDGAFLWQLWCQESDSDDWQLFAGEVVFLMEIDRE